MNNSPLSQRPVPQCIRSQADKATHCARQVAMVSKSHAFRNIADGRLLVSTQLDCTMDPPPQYEAMRWPPCCRRESSGDGNEPLRLLRMSRCGRRRRRTAAAVRGESARQFTHWQSKHEDTALANYQKPQPVIWGMIVINPTAGLGAFGILFISPVRRCVLLRLRRTPIWLGGRKSSSRLPCRRTLRTSAVGLILAAASELRKTSKKSFIYSAFVDLFMLECDTPLSCQRSRSVQAILSYGRTELTALCLFPQNSYEIFRRIQSYERETHFSHAWNIFLVGGSVNLVGETPNLTDYLLWDYPPWFHWVTGTLEVAKQS